MLSQRKSSYEQVALTKAWIVRGEGDDEHTPSVIWQMEHVTPALDRAAKERHTKGFAAGVQEGLRTAPAGAAQADPSQGTKRPAGVAFSPEQGNTPGSAGGGAGQTPGMGGNAGSPQSPPYLDPRAPRYMPGSAAQSPNSGGPSSGPGTNAGSPEKNAGSPEKPYSDPGAPAYWPETPQYGGQSSGGSHSGGSPGSGSGQGGSPGSGGSHA